MKDIVNIFGKLVEGLGEEYVFLGHFFYCVDYRIYTFTLKASFGAPQIGQTQLSGIFSKGVPGTTPEGGSPSAGS